MSKKRNIDSREVGLEAGLIFMKNFLRTEHLHYGYWREDMEVTPWNLAEAQENHSRLVISNIPEGVKTILDVGCGGGILDMKLTQSGFSVDCVSPSKLLTENARKLLGDKSQIFESVFEDVNTDKRYDLILFSESFQYVKIDTALQKCSEFLNDCGSILICDFFKTDTKGKLLMGGGHKISKFFEIMENHPFLKVKDIDITKETAENMKLFANLLMNVGEPSWDLFIHYLDKRYPRISRFLQWKFRKKIEKMKTRYFSGMKIYEDFPKYQTYRLMQFKKNGSAAS